MASSQIEVSAPPEDAISGLALSTADPDKLLVSSWDGRVALYSLSDGGRKIEDWTFEAAVLAVEWGASEQEAFVGGLWCDVVRLDLSTGEKTILSSHDKPVKCLAYDPHTQILISASWDCTLHVHNLSATRTPSEYATISLPGKPFALALSPTKAVLALSSRINLLYTLSSLSTLPASASPEPTALTPTQTRESSMKFMTRSLACTPDDTGYASSSIEGRVAMEWFDPSEAAQKRKYAFKCHRLTADDGTDVVYPVNALAFHPQRNVFASGGGDGIVNLWDAVAKRRIKQYQRFTGGSGAASGAAEGEPGGAAETGGGTASAPGVVALGFSRDGKYLVIAISPGFEEGVEPLDMRGQVKIVIRELGPDEAKMKGKK